MVAHIHFSVNTTIRDIHETYSWCAVTLACVCAGARGVAQGSFSSSFSSNDFAANADTTVPKH